MIEITTHIGSISFWRAAAATTLLGLFLGLLGPFGSFLNEGFGLRLVYWVGAAWTGLLLYGTAFIAADKAAPEGSRARWPVLVLAVLIASVPQSLLTRGVAFLLWPRLNQIGPGLGAWSAEVILISTTIVAGFLLFMRFQARGSARAGPEDAREVGPSSSRPPVALLRGDIIALQMEDHYVRVHTPDGSELVLMPLARAIEAVAAVEGLRTHRSWWVARSAVRQVQGSPRSMALRLSNGLTAPVARSAVATLRGAGWFDGR